MQNGINAENHRKHTNTPHILNIHNYRVKCFGSRIYVFLLVCCGWCVAHTLYCGPTIIILNVRSTWLLIACHFVFAAYTANGMACCTHSTNRMLRECSRYDILICLDTSTDDRYWWYWQCAWILQPGGILKREGHGEIWREERKVEFRPFSLKLKTIYRTVMRQIINYIQVAWNVHTSHLHGSVSTVPQFSSSCISLLILLLYIDAIL